MGKRVKDFKRRELHRGTHRLGRRPVFLDKLGETGHALEHLWSERRRWHLKSKFDFEALHQEERIQRIEIEIAAEKRGVRPQLDIVAKHEIPTDDSDDAIFKVVLPWHCLQPQTAPPEPRPKYRGDGRVRQDFTDALSVRFGVRHPTPQLQTCGMHFLE